MTPPRDHDPWLDPAWRQIITGSLALALATGIMWLIVELTK